MDRFDGWAAFVMSGEHEHLAASRLHPSWRAAVSHLIVSTMLALAVVGGIVGCSGWQPHVAARAQTSLPCATPSTPTTPDVTRCATPASASACPRTLVNTGEPPNINYAGLPRNLPWVAAENATPDGIIIGFQFYGDRALPVRGQFADGAMAKVLWIVDRDVRDFSLSATRYGDSMADPVTIDVNPALGTSREYPSTISLPDQGCWTVTISARTAEGESVTGKVVFESEQ